jgi:histidinol-phosphatase (PHP family)
MLPGDSHVHSEWSWDTPVGDMVGSCVRAIELGLPAIAFTEHVDHTVFMIALAGRYASDHLTALANPDGQLTPPEFDAIGYFEAIELCRGRFPDLRILSGLELGEPHRHPAASAKVLAAGRYDRVIGSLHALPANELDPGGGQRWAEPWLLYPHRDAHEVVREYLTEIPNLIRGWDEFSVLAHVDYPVRSWPAATAGPFDPRAFEDEFRYALRATADSGRALEINTRVPLSETILTWWREEGGDAVTFGSDAHLPSFVGHGFADAARMAEAYGFRPGRSPYDIWGRS